MESAENNHIPEQLPRDFKPWGGVTDPGHHDSLKFRYLVHAFNPFAKATTGIARVEVTRDNPDLIKAEDGDQSIDVFLHPDRLPERVSLSCSLIDQDHLGTWGNAGLIIEAPGENVIITSASDAGTLSESKKALLEQASKRKIMNADELLNRTGSISYNEVSVLANHEGRTVHLAGFFYKTTEEGEPLRGKEADRLKQHAKRLNLPIIAIDVPNPYKESKIINTRNGKITSIALKGRLYSLKEGEKNVFRASSQKGITWFANPKELEEIVNFLREKGASDDDIVELRESYAEADSKRQKPVVKFDKNGDVFCITKRIGYEEEERIINIYKHSANWTYALEESKKWVESSLSNDTFKITIKNEESPCHTPSDIEINGVVQETLTLLSGEEKEKMERWYEEVKKSLSKKASQKAL